MLGLSFGEILVVALIALLVVGPDNLPQFARSAGRMYGQIRRMADDLRRGLVLEADRQDAEARLEALRRRREEAEAQQRAAEEASPGVQPQPAPWEPPDRSGDDDPEGADSGERIDGDEELHRFVDDPSGPYAAGRSLDEVAAAWRDAPADPADGGRRTRPFTGIEPQDLSDDAGDAPRARPFTGVDPDELPDGVTPEEWAELPPRIRALLRERSGR